MGKSQNSIAFSAVRHTVTATAPKINAQVYTAGPINASFTPLSGALLTFSVPTSDAVTTGEKALNIKVKKGTRILMVIYSTSTSNAGTVQVYLNGSISLT